MYSLFTILFSLICISCTSLKNVNSKDYKPIDYKYSRQMDERSMKTSFMER